MGAKYIPNIKDLKANQRFLQKQRALPKTGKALQPQPPKSDKKV